MPKPIIAGCTPTKVEVKEGEKIFFCTCGHSSKQPYCDGSHKGTEFACLPYVPEKTGTLFLCNCKQTKNAPLCDGSHKPYSDADIGTEGPEV